MAHIFISYARDEAQDLARQLRDALNAHQSGFTAWMDEALISGKSWASQIEEEIARSDWVIVLLTPDVNRPADGPKGRSFVLNEIDYALAQHKRIIPVLADARTKIPIQLAGIHYKNITHLSSRNEQVRAVIETLTSPPPSLSARRKQPLFARARRLLSGTATVILRCFRNLKPSEAWAIIIAAIITGLFLLLATLLDNKVDSPTETAVVPSATFTNTAMPTTEVANTLPPTAAVTMFPTSASTTTPATFSLDFQVMSTYLLVQVDSASTSIDLSDLRIRWNNSSNDLGLHTLIWYENYNAIVLDFTSLPVGSCLLLATKQEIWDKPAKCTTVYVSEYFLSLSDFRTRTQRYSMSLDGGNTYPEKLICAGSQASCRIP